MYCHPTKRIIEDDLTSLFVGDLNWSDDNERHRCKSKVHQIYSNEWTN